MEQTVMVMEVKQGEARVRSRRSTACGSCAGKSSCTTLGSWFERFAEMIVVDPLGVRVGDEVVIEVPDGEFLRAALRLYGAPMLGFFLVGFTARACAIALAAAEPELWAAAGALAGMSAVFLWFRRGHQQQMSGAKIVRIRAQAVGIPVHGA